jgi:polysaccharide deacetylase 2 family uncharacterized protein YibQ
MEVTMDISNEQYKKDILLEMEEEKRLQIELEQANKDIERKVGIIAFLGSLIINTQNEELIIKMNEGLANLM